MYKMYTIYYKTFLQDEVIQNEWTEAVNLTPIACELMVRNKRCHNFDMICSDVNSCHYEGVRVPNYAWLKEHTGVVYNCIYYKRTIVAADLASNLFGINGCTADKLYCNLHDSIVIWTNQIIDQCAFDVLLRTDLYVEDVLYRPSQQIQDLQSNTSYSQRNSIRSSSEGVRQKPNNSRRK